MQCTLTCRKSCCCCLDRLSLPLLHTWSHGSAQGGLSPLLLWDYGASLPFWVGDKPLCQAQQGCTASGSLQSALLREVMVAGVLFCLLLPSWCLQT